MIRNLTHADYLHIYENLEAFWGERKLCELHHPLFVKEFGQTAFVSMDDNRIAAYLMGFFSPDPSYFYVHLISVRREFRRMEIARSLYEHVFGICRARQILRVRAITTFENKPSRLFHEAMGFKPIKTENDAELHADYAGPGETRIIFQRSLSCAS